MNTEHRPVTIDLDQFKLHIDIKKRIELTLHFNSPSRRFYLSVIAFVANESKRLGKITSIPLGVNHDLLVLLNDTVGGSAGSSEKENLLPRIYRKWKDALPNLEEAPLFKVLGKQKKYDEGAGKAYAFSEAEKDNWANLFEYTGSEENVRLKFAIDKIGASIEDVVIIYENSTSGDPWERFLSSLKKQVEKVSETELSQPALGTHESPVPLPSPKGTGLLSRYRWMALIAIIVMIVGAATWVIWESSLKPALVQTASVDRMAFPLPDKPSIAVIPFLNISGDPGQDFVADGITESIITALSSVPQLFVIARNSTFTYKGKAVKVQRVAEELGVRYVLEGSILRSGDRIRVTAQLIDALRGHHLWAERYDRELKDLFALQDDLTKKIITGINVKLTSGEQALYGRPPKSIETWIKSLQCSDYLRHFNIDSNNRARTIAEEIIALEPDHPGGYVSLGCFHMMDYWLGSTKNPAHSLNLAIELLEKGAAMTDRKGNSLEILGYLYALKGDYDKAIEVGEQAVAMIPNGADAYAWLAMSLNVAGRPGEALPLFQKAKRLNPLPPAFYYLNCGNSYRVMGRFEEALTMYTKAVQLTPNNAMAHMNLAATYGLMGREEEARASAAVLLRINPKFSVEYAIQIFPVQAAYIEQLAQGLRKAGLK